MSRTIIWLVAVGAGVIALALGVAWYATMHDRAAIRAVAAPSSVAPVPKVPEATPADTSPSAAVMAPSFDVARIGRDGQAVIAGRATPRAKIVLLDGGKEIARGEADAQGEWVLLLQEAPLAPGQHELRIVQHVEGRAPVTSEQVVIVVVPAPENKTDETLVMIAPPGGTPTLVQPPSAAGVPKSADLQLSTLDYDERGRVTMSGQALVGTTVRAYIDEKVVGEAIAAKDKVWRMVATSPVEPGKHVLRLDRLGPDGKPLARLELPFERLATGAGNAAGNSGGEGNRRLSVLKGDNLWSIARAHYGEGVQFTVIFGANKEQIRDPNLIYPGQTFTLPKVN